MVFEIRESVDKPCHFFFFLPFIYSYKFCLSHSLSLSFSHTHTHIFFWVFTVSGVVRGAGGVQR